MQSLCFNVSVFPPLKKNKLGAVKYYFISRLFVHNYQGVTSTCASMIYNFIRKIKPRAGSGENRSRLTHHQLPRHPTNQTGMLLFMLRAESVEVIITVVELSERSRRDHSPECSSKGRTGLEERRKGSKWQKCCRTTIREPQAKCECSPAAAGVPLCNASCFQPASQPEATAVLSIKLERRDVDTIQACFCLLSFVFSREKKKKDKELSHLVS